MIRVLLICFFILVGWTTSPLFVGAEETTKAQYQQKFEELRQNQKKESVTASKQHEKTTKEAKQHEATKEKEGRSTKQHETIQEKESTSRKQYETQQEKETTQRESTKAKSDSDKADSGDRIRMENLKKIYTEFSGEWVIQSKYRSGEDGFLQMDIEPDGRIDISSTTIACYFDLRGRETPSFVCAYREPFPIRGRTTIWDAQERKVRGNINTEDLAVSKYKMDPDRYTVVVYDINEDQADSSAGGLISESELGRGTNSTVTMVGASGSHWKCAYIYRDVSVHDLLLQMSEAGDLYRSSPLFDIRQDFLSQLSTLYEINKDDFNYHMNVDGGRVPFKEQQQVNCALPEQGGISLCIDTGTCHLMQTMIMKHAKPHNYQTAVTFAGVHAPLSSTAIAGNDEVAVGWDPWTKSLLAWRKNHGWKLMAKFDTQTSLQLDDMFDQKPQDSHGVVSVRLIKAYPKRHEIAGTVEDFIKMETQDLQRDEGMLIGEETQMKSPQIRDLFLYLASYTVNVGAQRDRSSGITDMGNGQPHLYRIRVDEIFEKFDKLLPVICAQYDYQSLRNKEARKWYLNLMVHPECFITEEVLHPTVQELIYKSIQEDEASLGAQNLCELAQRAYNCHTGSDLKCSLRDEETKLRSPAHGIFSSSIYQSQLDREATMSSADDGFAMIEHNCPEMRRGGHCVLPSTTELIKSRRRARNNSFNTLGNPFSRSNTLSTRGGVGNSGRGGKGGKSSSSFFSESPLLCSDPLNNKNCLIRDTCSFPTPKPEVGPKMQWILQATMGECISVGLNIDLYDVSSSGMIPRSFEDLDPESIRRAKIGLFINCDINSSPTGEPIGHLSLPTARAQPGGSSGRSVTRFLNRGLIYRPPRLYEFWRAYTAEENDDASDFAAIHVSNILSFMNDDAGAVDETRNENDEWMQQENYGTSDMFGGISGILGGISGKPDSELYGFPLRRPNLGYICGMNILREIDPSIDPTVSANHFHLIGEQVTELIVIRIPGSARAPWRNRIRDRNSETNAGYQMPDSPFDTQGQGSRYAKDGIGSVGRTSGTNLPSAPSGEVVSQAEYAATGILLHKRLVRALNFADRTGHLALTRIEPLSVEVYFFVAGRFGVVADKVFLGMNVVTVMWMQVLSPGHSDFILTNQGFEPRASGGAGGGSTGASANDHGEAMSGGSATMQSAVGSAATDSRGGEGDGNAKFEDEAIVGVLTAGKVLVFCPYTAGNVVFSYTEQQSHVNGFVDGGVGMFLVVTSTSLDTRVWYAQWSLYNLRVAYPTVGVARATVEVSHPDIPVCCVAARLPQQAGSKIGSTALEALRATKQALPDPDSSTSSDSTHRVVYFDENPLAMVEKIGVVRELTVICGVMEKGLPTHTVDTTVEVPQISFDLVTGDQARARAYTTANGRILYRAREKKIELMVQPAVGDQHIPTAIDVRPKKGYERSNRQTRSELLSVKSVKKEGNTIGNRIGTYESLENPYHAKKDWCDTATTVSSYYSGTYEKQEGIRGRTGYPWYRRIHGIVVYQIFYWKSRWVMTQQRVTAIMTNGALASPRVMLFESEKTRSRSPAKVKWKDLDITANKNAYGGLVAETTTECTLNDMEMRYIQGDPQRFVFEAPPGLHLEAGRQHAVVCSILVDKNLFDTRAAVSITAGTNRDSTSSSKQYTKNKIYLETIEGLVTVPKPAFTRGPFIKRLHRSPRSDGLMEYQFDVALKDQHSGTCELIHEDLHDWRRKLLGLRTGITDKFDRKEVVQMGDTDKAIFAATLGARYRFACTCYSENSSSEVSISTLSVHWDIGILVKRSLNSFLLVTSFESIMFVWFLESILDTKVMNHLSSGTYLIVCISLILMMLSYILCYYILILALLSSYVIMPLVGCFSLNLVLGVFVFFMAPHIRAFYRMSRAKATYAQQMALIMNTDTKNRIIEMQEALLNEFYELAHSGSAESGFATTADIVVKLVQMQTEVASESQRLQRLIIDSYKSYKLRSPEFPYLERIPEFIEENFKYMGIPCQNAGCVWWRSDWIEETALFSTKEGIAEGFGDRRNGTDWVSIFHETIGCISNAQVSKLSFYADQAKWCKVVFKRAMTNAVNLFNDKPTLGDLNLHLDAVVNRWDHEHPAQKLVIPPFEANWVVDETRELNSAIWKDADVSGTVCALKIGPLKDAARAKQKIEALSKQITGKKLDDFQENPEMYITDSLRALVIFASPQSLVLFFWFLMYMIPEIEVVAVQNHMQKENFARIVKTMIADGAATYEDLADLDNLENPGGIAGGFGLESYPKANPETAHELNPKQRETSVASSSAAASSSGPIHADGANTGEGGLGGPRGINNARKSRQEIMQSVPLMRKHLETSGDQGVEHPNQSCSKLKTAIALRIGARRLHARLNAKMKTENFVDKDKPQGAAMTDCGITLSIRVKQADFEGDLEVIGEIVLMLEPFVLIKNLERVYSEIRTAPTMAPFLRPLFYTG